MFFFLKKYLKLGGKIHHFKAKKISFPTAYNLFTELKHFIKAKVERKNLRKITVKYVFQAKFGHFSVDYEFLDAKLKFSAIYLLSWT